MLCADRTVFCLRAGDGRGEAAGEEESITMLSLPLLVLLLVQGVCVCVGEEVDEMGSAV